MKTVHVAKADPALRDDPELESCTLIVDGEVPQLGSAITLKELERYYRTQAELIESALCRLPGGTRHQLLILLLESNQHLYRVPDEPATK
jgi:hypothetical protein